MTGSSQQQSPAFGRGFAGSLLGGLTGSTQQSVPAFGWGSFALLYFSAVHRQQPAAVSVPSGGDNSLDVSWIRFSAGLAYYSAKQQGGSTGGSHHAHRSASPLGKREDQTQSALVINTILNMLRRKIRPAIQQKNRPLGGFFGSFSSRPSQVC